MSITARPSLLSLSLIITSVLTACALALSSCSSGGSGTAGVSQAVGVFTAPYLVVDLSSGALESRVAIPDLTSNAVYQTSKLVFRRVEVGSGVQGSAVGDFAVQASEVPQSTTAVSIYFLAVFELTQAQWTALGGSSLWTLPEAAAGGGVVAARAPAYNLDRSTVETLLTTYSAGRSYRFALPSDQQWEYACRAGNNNAAFAWGAGIDIATDVKPNAVVFETLDGVQGPRIADGTRGANALGFYDMPGNGSGRSVGVAITVESPWEGSCMQNTSLGCSVVCADSRIALVSIPLALLVLLGLRTSARRHAAADPRP